MRFPFARILVPYDGSEVSDSALQDAVTLAGPGTTLTLVNVVDQTPFVMQASSAVAAYDPQPMLDALQACGRAVLENGTALARKLGAEPQQRLEMGAPVAGIVHAATATNADLIVMGTHAHQGLKRAFLGSTTEGVLRSSDVPVLAVGPLTPGNLTLERILVGVDDSEPADAAVALSGAIARATGAQLMMCTVVDTRDVDEKARDYGYDPTPIAQSMRAAGERICERAQASVKPAVVEGRVLEGEPVEALLQTAAGERAGLIVLGSHGRRGLGRMLFGSVAERVVRASPLPVLVVRSAPKAFVTQASVVAGRAAAVV